MVLNLCFLAYKCKLAATLHVCNYVFLLFKLFFTLWNSFYNFQCHKGQPLANISLQIPGAHNVLNSLAVSKKALILNFVSSSDHVLCVVRTSDSEGLYKIVCLYRSIFQPVS